MITHNNYHISTRANFKVCKTPKRKPDYVSPYRSKYWYGSNKHGDYVIRQSDHWAGLFDLKKRKKIGINSRKIGKCIWNIIAPINNTTDDDDRRYNEINRITHYPLITEYRGKHTVKRRSCEQRTDIRIKQITGKCYLSDFKNI